MYQEKLKNGARIDAQIKMLGRLAFYIEQSPRDTREAIVHYFDFSSEQLRTFLSAYQKAGDDPLEV